MMDQITTTDLLLEVRGVRQAYHKESAADLVVLDKNYFTVSDAEMRRIRPIMTIVNGRIVHDTGALGHRGR